MLEKMKELVKANDLCVLATVSEGRPHCSLMSYISDEDGHEIFLIFSQNDEKVCQFNGKPNGQPSH